MKNLIAFALLLAAAAQAPAQLSVPSYSGTVLLNGNTYAGEDLNGGDQLTISASQSGVSLASMLIQPKENPEAFFPGRYMMKFRATHNNAEVRLPSGRDGSKSLATHGETRVFSTWDTSRYPQTPNPHVFGLDIDATNGTGQVDVDLQKAPLPTGVRTGGTFLTDRLDNSIYDQDPDVGDIVIDKGLTPTVVLNFSLPEMTFTRNELEWNDASKSPSMFRDDSSTSMWFLLGSRIFTAEFSPSKTFAANEGLATKIVDPFAGTLTMDLATVEAGDYTGSYWSIAWNTFGYDNEQGNLSIGRIDQDFSDQRITVVPEPMSLAVLGLGFLAMLRHRRR